MLLGCRLSKRKNVQPANTPSDTHKCIRALDLAIHKAARRLFPVFPTYSPSATRQWRQRLIRGSCVGVKKPAQVHTADGMTGKALQLTPRACIERRDARRATIYRKKTVKKAALSSNIAGSTFLQGPLLDQFYTRPATVRHWRRGVVLYQDKLRSKHPSYALRSAAPAVAIAAISIADGNGETALTCVWVGRVLKREHC